MSKSISFGFGKQKPATPVQGGGLLARRHVASNGPSRTALCHDSDYEDEEEPRHESVTGFSSSGAVLSQPVQESKELVIKNTGNSDWRRRGHKNILPAGVQARQAAGGVVVIERDEVSTAGGLQFAQNGGETKEPETNGKQQPTTTELEEKPRKELTADEEALQALLDDRPDKPKSKAVIGQQGNTQLSSRDEIEDFRDDVASRPDSSTLEEYAAMPVEEFGMAMLRGMGQKRRANGEVINLISASDGNPRKLRKQEGFLGIGAKAAPGTDIELGAWGKTEMRKNNKGQGFFTPLMRENKATGERISEEELQRRIKESKGTKDEEDWRKRRDRNLESDGRDRDRDRDRDRRGLTNGNDDYRDQMNSFSRSRSSKRDRDDREYSRSKRDKDDRDYDRDYDHSRSRREENRRRQEDGDYDSRHRNKHRDRYRDEDRYDSSPSYRNRRNRDKDMDRDSDHHHRDRR
ncbi:uncharacterized protein Z518_04897 [Rhinocladiella mackenziei CBS 650.93]|uniref:Pre-mRNA-splicing factor n=1 Tax=Rhinocladiella mackenziei CBS 650.93 TaxID=1442369 RepID=A0A0D2IUT1_9EURO|nr:uncharacterized protein Z518_04897 [Rhinocladiella mackenziei CBS 650.93]KIX06921.1 hypothetical protein Z518_04897 [Rhinocladiella mackenziei CBS 650.93]